jgi:hypothetical protein
MNFVSPAEWEKSSPKIKMTILEASPGRKGGLCGDDIPAYAQALMRMVFSGCFLVAWKERSEIRVL